MALCLAVMAGSLGCSDPDPRPEDPPADMLPDGGHAWDTPSSTFVGLSGHYLDSRLERALDMLSEAARLFDIEGSYAASAQLAEGPPGLAEADPGTGPGAARPQAEWWLVEKARQTVHCALGPAPAEWDVSLGRSSTPGHRHDRMLDVFARAFLGFCLNRLVLPLSGAHQAEDAAARRKRLLEQRLAGPAARTGAQPGAPVAGAKGAASTANAKGAAPLPRAVCSWTPAGSTAPVSWLGAGPPETAFDSDQEAFAFEFLRAADHSRLLRAVETLVLERLLSVLRHLSGTGHGTPSLVNGIYLCVFLGKLHACIAQHLAGGASAPGRLGPPSPPAGAVDRRLLDLARAALGPSSNESDPPPSDDPRRLLLGRAAGPLRVDALLTWAVAGPGDSPRSTDTMDALGRLLIVLPVCLAYARAWPGLFAEPPVGMALRNAHTLLGRLLCRSPGLGSRGSLPLAGAALRLAAMLHVQTSATLVGTTPAPVATLDRPADGPAVELTLSPWAAGLLAALGPAPAVSRLLGMLFGTSHAATVWSRDALRGPGGHPSPVEHVAAMVEQSSATPASPAPAGTMAGVARPPASLTASSAAPAATTAATTAAAAAAAAAPPRRVAPKRLNPSPATEPEPPSTSERSLIRWFSLQHSGLRSLGEVIATRSALAVFSARLEIAMNMEIARASAPRPRPPSAEGPLPPDFAQVVQSMADFVGAGATSGPLFELRCPAPFAAGDMLPHTGAPGPDGVFRELEHRIAAALRALLPPDTPPLVAHYALLFSVSCGRTRLSALCARLVVQGTALARDEPSRPSAPAPGDPADVSLTLALASIGANEEAWLSAHGRPSGAGSGAMALGPGDGRVSIATVASIRSFHKRWLRLTQDPPAAGDRQHKRPALEVAARPMPAATPCSACRTALCLGPESSPRVAHRLWLREGPAAGPPSDALPALLLAVRDALLGFQDLAPSTEPNMQALLRERLLLLRLALQDACVVGPGPLALGRILLDPTSDPGSAPAADPIMLLRGRLAACERLRQSIDLHFQNNLPQSVLGPLQETIQCIASGCLVTFLREDVPA
ncbi:hypothetical protein H696_04145 [Fonticula alba]|uniref:Uncharacterized protein n=1 Tax=Fonticula alba TaxID=691883 RepID=A0A058Z6I8_FONAL|nr:hypothetical protein H696_04145 [Fonticula alba]KCV69741.1 hypothetical protein H696_04145 [Fonticula alba]|eukprot:XP_009496306.1 hypothetical protein H696_04145 [Fonticula alba]